MAESWPPKFEIDPQRILTLLTGDRFYSSADAALREGTLNAVDACGRRRASQGTEPDIRVTFDDELRRVTISDNGVGMSRDDVADLFATVGASAAEHDGSGYQAVGEFGVGVISYFLVCERFELHTMKQGEPAVALEFPTSMLDGMGTATEITPIRDEIGTSIVFHVIDEARYDRLIERFPYWFRGVAGLHAERVPGNAVLAEGTSSLPAVAVDVPMPDWLEQAEIGAPGNLDSWSRLDGGAHIDILYRGVFVQSLSVNGLWGIEGSLWVDPKHLKPRLNRESFGSGELVSEVEPFLRSCHPAILDAALATLLATLDDDGSTKWSDQRLVTLWLALPRSAGYEEVAAKWDDFFRTRQLFRLWEGSAEGRPASLTEISTLVSEIFLAPEPSSNQSDVVRAAVRVLRATGQTVIQGIARDQTYFTSFPFSWQTDTDLLLAHFTEGLPPISRVTTANAHEILQRDGVVTPILSAPPRVCLVQLGAESAPIVVAQGEVWINSDTSAGIEMVRMLCEDNQGRLSLLVACHTFAPAQVNELTPALGRLSGDADERLGLLSREFIRGLVS
jgi:hypothetical protein